MTDLIDSLTALRRTDVDAPSAATVDADVARGRAALHRRHVRIGATAASFTVVAAGVAAFVALDHADSGHVTTLSSAGPGGPGGTSGTSGLGPGTGGSTVQKVELVDYTGQQPQGFNVTTVPDGFDLELQASTPYEFLVAPAGATDRHPDSFVGKLVVTAETAATYGGLTSLGDQPVTVNGAAGRIADDGTATQIWWQIGNVVVDVQSWDSIGLTRQQLIDFADGVSVTSQLQLSKG